jgi:stage II sporulation protein D
MLKLLRPPLRLTFATSVALCLIFVLFRGDFVDAPAKPDKRTVAMSVDEIDQRLQVAAESALGEREGAIVVLDPQSGRVHAVVNTQLAFDQAFTPGSTIKPFVTLAALRSQTINRDTRIRCRGKYKRTRLVDACAHARKSGRFDAAEALAYSCNYYFATVGERLNEDDLAHTLSEFGFGRTTGINDDHESAGVLARGRWGFESSVGEGAFLQVTPIQMALAYAAFFNGGKLFRPFVAGGPDFKSQLRAEVHVDDGERSIVLEGMRGAVEFGTAKSAHLDSLSAYIVGKTGTATPLQGFRPQGWFVGIAFPSAMKTEPANAQLAIVVYLRKGHGAEAAEVARSIFETLEDTHDTKKDSLQVSVHQVTENSTYRMPLEDYVTGVVSSEASIEDEPEALKALAVAVRTYALKNIGRHKNNGYDFCSTTHCQRFSSTPARPALATAVRQTSGLVLLDDQHQIIDAYFSASCGGMTANIKTLWGVDGPAYLRGVHDDYCNSGAHYRWTDVIASNQLAKALRSDPRTDVGPTIRDLSVTKYDDTGRAELLSIVGDGVRTISGWEFKLIVGRALGWNLLKSSRFSVSRSGSQFVFHGGGFGHGLGLCQEGSHAMAERGQSFPQILTYYFPGTTVGEYRTDSETRRCSHVRVVHPRSVTAQDVEQVCDLVETNRTDLLRRISAAGIGPRFPDVEIVFNETTGDFVGRTGMPPWAAAATKGMKIELQPLTLLKQRRILETTLRHELAHALIDTLGGGQTPRWLAEGMAVYLAGEGKLLEPYKSETLRSAETVERLLMAPKSLAEMRTAYANADALVRELIRTDGENAVWKIIVGPGRYRNAGVGSCGLF